MSNSSATSATARMVDRGTIAGPVAPSPADLATLVNHKTQAAIIVSRAACTQAQKSLATAKATIDTASVTLCTAYALTATQQAAIADKQAAYVFNAMQTAIQAENNMYGRNDMITSQAQYVIATTAASAVNAAVTATQAAAAGAQVAAAAAVEYNALAAVVIPSSGPSTSIQNMSAFYYFSLFPFRYANATFKQPLYISKFLVDTILNNGYKTQLYGYSDRELFTLMYGFAYVAMADEAQAMTSDGMRAIIIPVYQFLWGVSTQDPTLKFAMAMALNPTAVNTTKTGRAAIAQMYGKLCLALYN